MKSLDQGIFRRLAKRAEGALHEDWDHPIAKAVFRGSFLSSQDGYGMNEDTSP